MAAKRLDEEDVSKNKPTVSDYAALLRALKSLTEEEIFNLASGKAANVRLSGFRFALFEKYMAENPLDKRPDESILQWIHHEITRLRGVKQPAIPLVMRKKTDLVADWKAMVEKITGIYILFHATIPQEREGPENMERQHPGDQQQHGVDIVPAPDPNNALRAHNDICGQYTSISKPYAFEAVRTPADGLVQENDTNYVTKYRAEPSEANARKLEITIAVDTLRSEDVTSEQTTGQSDANGQKAASLKAAANGSRESAHDVKKSRQVDYNTKFSSLSATCGLAALHPPGERLIYENEMQFQPEEESGDAERMEENDIDKTLSVDEADDLMLFEPRGKTNDVSDRNVENVEKTLIPTKEERILQKEISIRAAPSCDSSCLQHKAAGDSLRKKDIYCEVASGEKDAYGEKEANMHTAANGCTGAPCPDPHPNDDQNADKVYSNMKFSSLSMTCGLAALHPPGENLIFENSIQFQPEEESGDAERMEENDVDKTLSRNVEELEEKKESRDGDKKLENPGLALIPNKVDRHLQEENSLRLAPSGENSMENGCGCVGDLAALRVENNEIRHELEIHRERVKEMEERVSSLEAVLNELLAKKRDPNV